MDRIIVATLLAESRGEKVAGDFDFYLADKFLDGPFMAAHDRKVRREAIEDMACWIPEHFSTLMNGESPTKWLADQAEKLQ